MTQFLFKSKEFVYNHHLTVPFHPFDMHADKGIGRPRLDGNLVIHGDNLRALQALMPMYADKIDCVFIDPPYNTGNEGWRYNDNVNSPMIKEWLEANGIGADDPLRHDKWCAMMWPRLKLLRELLAWDGVIFISIDDNEQHHLRLMMDEIFGERNSVAQLVAQTNPRGRSLRQDVAQTHEYILVYAKKATMAEIQKIPKTGRTLSEYNKSDDKGAYRLLRLRNSGVRFFNKKTRPNLFFPIYVDPASGDASLSRSEEFSVEVLPVTNDGVEGCWTWSKDKISDNPGLVVGKKVNGGNWRVYRKDYLQGESLLTRIKSVLVGKEINNEVGSETLAKLFSNGPPFEYPKSPALISGLIRLIGKKDAIILDSFAGSGTTAHAVLELNKEDGGKRKFILVEMEDYADSLTAERVRRVINGYDFQGAQKTELLREKVTWSKLQKADKLVAAVAAAEKAHAAEYDAIKKTVKDGELIVTGEKTVAARADGVGGDFTYCELGSAVELERMLSGESLPPYAGLGAALFLMATRGAIDMEKMREEDCYLGETEDECVWMIYKPDLDWLMSPASAFTLDFARKIVAAHPRKRHLVLASMRFVSMKLLAEENLNVEFAALPYALCGVERS